ncbi:hypothetical protein VN24_02410 [Paenibacillus beijingensis]|uniref:N-acetyltransferase domain-containing protein n=1 Tax=Paenibacillus beijingensis TaxID=1126833 RepID=A0A0D5NR08_9BACL|nr:hypothetical protein VN24_02410 [Paenibacillus beijingensis]
MLIRLRAPRTDDGAIISLIRKELIPLSQTVHPRDAQTLRTLKKRLRNGSTIVAAKSKTAAPIGFIHYEIVSGIIHIDLLAVHPDYRGFSIGRSLLAAAENDGRRSGCVLSRLFVDEGNEKAHRFYKRCGYTAAGYHAGLKCTEMIKPF